MLRAHELPEPIAWYEGMLLAPHHFQQLTRRQDELLYYHTRTLSPHHWGVRRFAFDQVLLINGILRVIQLEAILPDGLVVAHQARQGEADLEVSLAAHHDTLRERPMTVHLAVPVYHSPGRVMKGMLERYESREGAPVVDESTGDGEMRIPRRRPRLSLLLADATPEKYVSLPLARIRYQNDRYLVTDYVPPTIALEAGSPLVQIGVATARMLREKATFLAEQVRSPSMTMASPQMLLRRHQVHAMVAALPRFEEVLHTAGVHPFLLYLAFCDLAGHLAAVGHALVPPVFARYDHEDIHACFRQVQAFVERVVEEGIQQTHTVFVFRQEEGIFYLPMQKGWFDRKLVLGARARSDMAEHELVEWMEGSLIGSESHLKAMRERRVLGAPRRRVDESDGLVPSQGMALFELDPQPAFVSAGEHLIVVGGDTRGERPHPAELVLYVKN